MIDLTKQMWDEFGLTYWKHDQGEEQQKSYVISREEKELLRKILLAKGINLTDQMIEVQEQGVVIITVNAQQLIFDDVTMTDSEKTTHLSKLSVMLNSAEQKKFTWYKLKNLNL